jgi:mono/diheme cytochrome c family protein
LGVAGFRSLCALCALYALCVLRGNATAQQGVANPFQGDAQAVDEGREIYNRTCTTCHGADGACSEMGPALGAPARRYALATDAQIVDAIKNGIPTTQMPRFGGGRLADDAI